MTETSKGMIETSSGELKQALATGGPIVLAENLVPLGTRIGLSVWVGWMIYIMFFARRFTPRSDPYGPGSLPVAPLSAGEIAGWTLGIAAWIYLISFWKKRLTLNVREHTFLWESGLSPFLKRRSGSLDASAPARLVQDWYTAADSETSRTLSRWLLHLSPKEGSEPPPALILSVGSAGHPSREEARGLAERLASMLGQPLDTSKAKRTYSEAKAEKANAELESPLPTVVVVSVLFGFFLLGGGWAVYDFAFRDRGQGTSYTVQVGGQVKTVSSMSWKGDEGYLLLNEGGAEGLVVNGKRYPAPPNHAHIRVKNGRVWINNVLQP